MGKHRHSDELTAGRSGKGRRLYLPIIFVLLALNIVFLYLWLHNGRMAKAVKEANKYFLIDYSRNFIDQENFFPTIEPIRKSLTDIVERYQAQGHRIGVYFEFLNTGANVSINQEARFWPASLSKMPTAFAAMKKVEDGEWRLDNELVLFQEDADNRFGELYKETPGTRFTIERLLKETLQNSDNTSHKILVRNLSGTDYDRIFQALGMEELYDKNYDITAKEYSRIFRALYTSSYLSREHSQLLLEWLSDTRFNYLLGSGLPKDVRFAHKIGEEYNESVFLDSGIFYVEGRPCLMTVMVQVKPGGTDKDAQEIMGTLAKAAYDYVASR